LGRTRKSGFLFDRRACVRACTSSRMKEGVSNEGMGMNEGIIIQSNNKAGILVSHFFGVRSTVLTTYRL
jgi:hypothetical protein